MASGAAAAFCTPVLTALDAVPLRPQPGCSGSCHNSVWGGKGRKYGAKVVCLAISWSVRDAVLVCLFWFVRGTVLRRLPWSVCVAVVLCPGPATGDDARGGDEDGG